METMTNRARAVRFALALAAIFFGAGSTFGTTCAPDSAGYTKSPLSGVMYYRVNGLSPPLVRAVPNVDADSFEELRPPHARGICNVLVDFARDRASVFYQGQVIEGADPSSFVFLNQLYAKDRNGVYFGRKRLTTRVNEFRMVQHPSFGYATDGMRYFYADVIVEESSLEFFGLVGGSTYFSYARSKTKVYNRGYVIAGADPETFTLSMPALAITKDKNKVYFYDRPIPNADPSSFVQLRSGWFGDKRAFYECPRATTLASRSAASLVPEHSCRESLK